MPVCFIITNKYGIKCEPSTLSNAQFEQRGNKAPTTTTIRGNKTMDTGDYIGIGALAFMVLIWVNLNMMGII